MPLKQTPTRGRSRKQAPELVEEKPVKKGVDAAVWSGLAVIGSLFMMVGVALFTAPHTHAAQKVIYTNGHMAQGALSGGLLPEYKEKLEAEQGVDFRLILRTADKENTAAMQRVAQACLPQEKFSATTMPGKGVHKVFAHATDYLLCAMTTEQSRFCQPAERKRLAAQLVQYRDRRQNALAVERNRDRMLASASAQYQMDMTRKVMDAQGSAPISRMPYVGETIDPRITASVRSLVEAGYLSPSDFGWMGLYLPEEYASELQVDATAQPACT